MVGKRIEATNLYSILCALCFVFMNKKMSLSVKLLYALQSRKSCFRRKTIASIHQ